MTEDILDTIENTLLDYHVSTDAMRWTPPEKQLPEPETAGQPGAVPVHGDVYVGTPDGGMVPLSRCEGLQLRAPRMDEDPAVSLAYLRRGVMTVEQASELCGEIVAGVLGEILALANAVIDEHRQHRCRISAMRVEYHRRRKARARRNR